MKNIALSIDLEDWYHGMQLPAKSSTVERDTALILELLSDEGVTGTFFVLGEIYGERPELIKHIADAGHEIAFHGAKHIFLQDLGRDAFHSGTEYWKKTIEDGIGNGVIGFRAPYFSISPTTIWAFEILEQLGFQYDASIYPGYNYRYGFEGAPLGPTRIGDSNLIEFPVPLVSKWFPIGYSGGAYLRILPFPLVSWRLEKAILDGEYGMIYAHPFEFGVEVEFSGKLGFLPNLTRHLFRKGFRRKFKQLVHHTAPHLTAFKDMLKCTNELPVWNLPR